MRVLFVPLTRTSAALSHLAPLVALRRLLPPDSTAAFVVPAADHRRLQRIGESGLPGIDHLGSVHTELTAYRKFRPDVVIDDCSISTAFATEIARVPRVTLARIGAFPGYRPRNPRHRHTLSLDNVKPPAGLGIAPPRELSDLFHAERAVIPAMPRVEPLPKDHAADAAYVYAGPLLLDDETIRQLMMQVASDHELIGFRERHRAAGRRLLFVTVGTVSSSWPELATAMTRLIDRDVAIVSTVPVDVPPRARDLFLHAPLVPLHLVCSSVDLVVHQCGSATYHYPIVHGLPSVTLGTKHYDRDDVAAHLEELGASVHVRHPDEEPDFVQSLVAAVRAHLGGANMGMMAAIRSLRDEMARLQADFDLQQVLAEAVTVRRAASHPSAL